MKFSGGLKYCVIVTITFLSMFSFTPASRADIHVFAHAPNTWLRDVTLQGLMEGGSWPIRRVPPTALISAISSRITPIRPS